MKKLVLISISLITVFGFAHMSFAQDCINCNDPFTTGDTLYRSKIGYNNTANGNYSFAGGENSLADNWRAFAFGVQAQAIGINSFALGANVESSGNGSFAFGNDAKSGSSGSFALGSRVNSLTALSFTIGSGPKYDYLINSEMETMVIGFNSTKPTLFISRSENDQYPYDKTGRVAIGNMTDPQAKLHIYSDEGENATLFLQPTNWGVENNAEIWLGNQNHGLSANVTEGMVYNTEVNHVFKGGDIYIEDIDQGIIMKSPDGRCWRGTLNNDGLLNFAELESCPEVITEIPETDIQHSESSLKVYPNPTEEFLTIEIENPENKNLEISLIDEKGVVMKTTKTGGSKTQLYTGDLKTGVYFIQLVGNGLKEVSKVIRN